MRERNDTWWERIVLSSFFSYDWLTNFWISQSTFTFICNEIRNEITKNDTGTRRAVSAETRVVKTLWFLASNADLRTISV